MASAEPEPAEALAAQLRIQVDPELLVLALTHRSYAYENGRLAHNERLEFLGDSILGQAVTVMLYRENPDLDEGELAKRDTGIKRALLDQTLISGVGNIYADEALWASRIHYDQPTRTLSRPRAKTLLAEVRLVLGRALAEGGTSFDAQYVNVNGASGYFSHSLNAYGQHGRPCPRCGRPIRREHFMNRGSHFCPWCQRIRVR